MASDFLVSDLQICSLTYVAREVSEGGISSFLVSGKLGFHGGNPYMRNPLTSQA